ncbi:MAG TPA: hypothetical protein VMR06_15915 [Dokdonella sp.]|uniref:hypothetical protein n=1 Tax=Dokdonella sp. TaxID=2291710 RepID=UPI002C16628A|nr:hypothetical protein [Dokdonella sp.]HUD43478.1 hypothetical protein [Dokdonella sp.]
MTSPPPMVDERAWQAQEQALRAAHGGVAGPDAATVADRRLLRALREPPLSPLPVDFAAEVARLAAPPAHARPADTRLERLLGAGLGIALGAAALVMGLEQGTQWLRAVAEQAPPGTLRFGVALIACVGSSWLIGLLPRSHSRGPLRH